MMGSNLRIQPTDNAVGSYQMWYVPTLTALSSDSDTVDSVMTRAGWEEYVIIEAAIKCLAKEELPNNIRVNVIAPGSIETEHLLEEWRQRHPTEMREDLHAIMPFCRLGKTEDIGNLIVFLASEKGEWISGHVIYVDGGASGYSVPRLLSYD